jgi:hypothetical protein
VRRFGYAFWIVIFNRVLWAGVVLAVFFIFNGLVQSSLVDFKFGICQGILFAILGLTHSTGDWLLRRYFTWRLRRKGR